MSRRLIREEGLLVGGSAGAAMTAALEIAKDLPEDKRIVAIFVDSVRNYMTKFLNDDWMLENEFFTQEEYDSKHFSKDVEIYGNDKLISDLNLPETDPVKLSSTVKEVLERFAKENIECVSYIIYIYI
jgi:cystathionine beta-synthase